MKIFVWEVLAASALTLVSSAALAHAMLQSSSPAVGSTVSGSPSQISLHFSEQIEPKFSGVTLKSADGAVVATGAPAVEPGDPSTLIVKVGKALAAGTYSVSWRAVSVDTHRTQGDFSFTVR